MKNLSLSSVAVLFFCLTNLSAQDYALKSSWEFSGRINYISTTAVRDGETSGESASTFSLYVPFYYFIIDGFSLGLIPGYEYRSYGHLSSSYFKMLGGAVYNLRTESIVFPYVEGRAGYITSSNGETKSGLIWSLGGGVKLRVGGNVLINLGLAYEQITLETSDNEVGRDGSNVWGVDIGLVVFIND